MFFFFYEWSLERSLLDLCGAYRVLCPCLWLWDKPGNDRLYAIFLCKACPFRCLSFLGHISLCPFTAADTIFSFFWENICLSSLSEIVFHSSPVSMFILVEDPYWFLFLILYALLQLTVCYCCILCCLDYHIASKTFTFSWNTYSLSFWNSFISLPYAFFVEYKVFTSLWIIALQLFYGFMLRLFSWTETLRHIHTNTCKAAPFVMSIKSINSCCLTDKVWQGTRLAADYGGVYLTSVWRGSIKSEFLNPISYLSLFCQS